MLYTDFPPKKMWYQYAKKLGYIQILILWPLKVYQDTEEKKDRKKEIEL